MHKKETTSLYLNVMLEWGGEENMLKLNEQRVQVNKCI